MHRSLLIAIILPLMALVTAVRADEVIQRGVREPPRVEHYDPLTDKFRYIESTFAPYHVTRPGGEFAYYGNRLQQFRYRGRPNTGGIYDALEEHRRKIGPDPVNYQYRWK